ncbi:uncharacterized protein BKA55DRAFT_695699 [Fusarium redolens]|uniref:Uncharacterized protein n=1 Tax=Fusarium redolens TaxID=48865 RepID=A0A9P9G384_FUSRE|nr:uncharacterized protein BKA55DRAFT_695699 [Fusarium redolens]KAH7232279.1 hypothetical protein BKA55DRAFT_695699 [Fusarium redolens]
MSDINKKRVKMNSELIRQGINQCLTLEADCKALKEKLAENQVHIEEREAHILQLRADHEELKEKLAEKDAIIEQYRNTKSNVTDRTWFLEHKDLRAGAAEVSLALEQVTNIEQSGHSRAHQPRARRHNIIRQSALTKQSQIQSPRTWAHNREFRPRLTRQDAQMYMCKEDRKKAKSDTLLALAYEGTTHEAEKSMEKLKGMASTLKLH